MMHGDQIKERRPTTHTTETETERLLLRSDDDDDDSMEMGDMSPQQTRDENKDPSRWEERYSDVVQSNGHGQSSVSRPAEEEEEEEGAPIVGGRGGVGGRTEYRVYRIRWFGLAQLILLNIVVSWDVRNLHLQ